MNNKFLSVIIFFLIFSFVSSSKFCNGQTCDDNCENCSYQCDPTTCLGKDNCYCATKEIPKGLTLEKTPQFVMLTMDDSFPDYLMTPIQNLDFLLKDPLIKDQNHCPLRLSAYVRHLDTDYHWLKYFESNGGSINLHTLTHETHFDKTKLADWKDELETNFKSIRELGRVNSIQGARAPFLEINDDYFTQLKNMGLKFDSSMTQYKDANDLLYWPFTLDYGVPVKKMCLDVGACPTQEHPGIWEFPLNFWTKTNGEPYDIMYQSIDIKTSLEDFKTDFDKTYNANRAPRGFYHHPQYYTINYNWKELDEDKVNVFREFYRYVASKPNVLFATESMIIEWLKNPVSFEETKKLPAFQCVPQVEKPSDVCTLTTCKLNDRSSLRICGREASCPLVQPALGGYPWSKFKGNTNNYNLNNDHIIEPDQDKNRWLGSAKITKASDWESGLCADI